MIDAVDGTEGAVEMGMAGTLVSVQEDMFRKNFISDMGTPTRGRDEIPPYFDVILEFNILAVSMLIPTREKNVRGSSGMGTTKRRGE